MGWDWGSIFSTVADAAQVYGGYEAVQGAGQTASATKDSYAIYAATNRTNAGFAQEQANYAKQVGAQTAGAVMLKAGQTLAQQKVAQGASGILIENQGTGADMAATTRYFRDRDLLNISQNTSKEYEAYHNQALNYLNNAAIFDQAAGGISPSNAQLNELIAVGTPILKQAATDWLKKHPNGS